MRVSRAKRRWVKWCRYVDKTQSQANPNSHFRTESHCGQVDAYADYMFARRWVPHGARYVWFPKWGSVR